MFFLPLNPNPNSLIVRKQIDPKETANHSLNDLRENSWHLGRKRGKPMLRLVQIAVLQLLLLAAISIPAVTSAEESIYEILRVNGLPMGLLPKGVKEFDIDGETGRFAVYLDQACNAKYESELHYEANVSGTLGYGWIGGLSGISAQELFLWFPVKGIHVDVPSSGVIYFDVGVVRKQLSMSLFETPRDCVAVRNEDEKIQSLMLPRYHLDQETRLRNIA